MADGADVIGLEMELPKGCSIEPGLSVQCVLRLWAADVLPGPLSAGTRLTILEGAKTVAFGHVESFDWED